MKRPCTEIAIGTPFRWACACGRNLPPAFLSEEDLWVGTELNVICEVEVLTAEQVLAENPEAQRCKDRLN